MTLLDTLRPHGKSWAGLAAGPTCWAIDTQLNYALVPWFCAKGLNIVPIIAAVLVVISLGGALASWFAWGRHEGPGWHIPEQDGHPHHLLCGIGVAAGVLFAMVIAMQGTAGLILSPCLR
jgi:ABC-type transporter Mla maintaining outer membrane lipid asymmetry permease subunit MlaE